MNSIALPSAISPYLFVGRAEGACVYDQDGRAYIDLISGISTCNLGHRHPAVMKAIREQQEKYLHVMVYGEFFLESQHKLAGKLANLLPSPLKKVFFVNSGAEANEGAIKLARLMTGRKKIAVFKNAYHGSSTERTTGLISHPSVRNIYPSYSRNTVFLRFNMNEDLKKINKDISCVIIELIQGEAGVHPVGKDFLQRLRKRCTETGTLLVFDEIQTGIGRTGKMFCLEHYGVVPDILTLGKALGGGLPLGAFVSSREHMDYFSKKHPLTHLTTFGGHPLSCAAGIATLETIQRKKILDTIPEKETLIRKLLAHRAVREIRGKGLMLGAEMPSPDILQKAIRNARENGVITDWFLFAPNVMRISPPLNISSEILTKGVRILIKVLEQV